jgi:CRP-like cAMP-binding protein
MIYTGTNKLLSRLSAPDRSMVVPHLRRFELIPGDILHAPHEPVSHVYFPQGGVLCVVVAFSDGSGAEAAVAGSNTVVGAAASVGDETALNRVIVLISGVADRIEAGVLRRLARESESLRNVLIRHSQALAAQSVQIAGCNAVHALEARLCRWLLQCRDLMNERTLPFTQDLISSMLGVYRPSLTQVLRKLESARLVAVSRGKIHILDADRLERCSCECYAALKEQTEPLIGASGVAAMHPIPEPSRSPGVQRKVARST